MLNGSVCCLVVKEVISKVLEVCWKSLRADVCKYWEPDDRTEISNFFLFYQTNLFSDLFSKMGLKGLISFYFFQNFDKSKIGLLNPRVPSWKFNFGHFVPFSTRSCYCNIPRSTMPFTQWIKHLFNFLLQLNLVGNVKLVSSQKQPSRLHRSVALYLRATKNNFRINKRQIQLQCSVIFLP